MAKTKKDPDLYARAKLGAQAQLSDIRHEAELLIDVFPHLRDSVNQDELPVDFILKKGRDRAEAAATKKPARRRSVGKHETA